MKALPKRKRATKMEPHDTPDSVDNAESSPAFQRPSKPIALDTQSTHESQCVGNAADGAGAREEELTVEVNGDEAVGTIGDIIRMYPDDGLVKWFGVLPPTAEHPQPKKQRVASLRLALSKYKTIIMEREPKAEASSKGGQGDS